LERLIAEKGEEEEEEVASTYATYWYMK